MGNPRFTTRKDGEVHGSVAIVELRCLACASTQRELIEAGIPRREAVKDITCSTCGRVGMMRAVTP